jgi:aminoglycoside/choline kinase family phosphotransferase
MSDFRERLENFLARRNQPLAIEQLTPDASTREYFRVRCDGRSAIACVYPEPFLAGEQTYLDVTRLFLSNGLPVAEVIAYDERLGIIIQEDLGDTILRDVLAASTDSQRDKLINDAIGIIARIQAATDNAFETGSVASKLKFDKEKLMWELDFFRTHYFETLKKQPLPDAEKAGLDSEFLELSCELESRAFVLCHRDFHAANLMIDSNGRMRIIDHQDARIGSPAYDLVSLLLDRITELPTAAWLAEKRALLSNERSTLGLAPLDETDFAYEFRLQTIQRCLKATGTFSFQSANRGKTHFLPFIKPMFRIVLRAAENLERFPVLRSILIREVQSGVDS